MATNLYQDLKELLADFKAFLNENVQLIKPVMQALAGLIPQLNDLVDLLIELMGKLWTEIDRLDVKEIEGIEKVTEFTTSVKALLNEAKKLLPDEADDIDKVLEVAEVVGGLPSLDQVKQEILTLINDIVALLNTLKSA